MHRILYFLRQLIAINKTFLTSAVSNKKQKLKDINYYELRDNVMKSSPVFVLSTGRCGTKLVSEYLKQLNGLDIVHNASPNLTYHSNQAYNSNGENSLGVFDGARYEMIQESYLYQRTFVECNNRITFFANQIKALYPNARFVHIIRDPYSFTKSGLVRGWYTGYAKHDDGRITDKSNPIWEDLKAAAKIAWLWTATNTFIEDFKRKIDPEKILTIRFEDLTSSKNPRYFGELVKFIAPNAPINNDQIRSYLKQPINNSKPKVINSIVLNYKDINDFLGESLLHKYDYKKRNL